MTSDAIPLVLTVTRLREGISSPDAVEWMREAVLSADAGRLVASGEGYLSVGLAGTEVHLLQRVAAAFRGRER